MLINRNRLAGIDPPRHGGFDLSCIDTVQLTLSKYKSLLSKEVLVTPFVNEEKLRNLNNKWKFSQICKENNIPQPKTELLISLNDIDKLDFNFPVIVKPLNNGGGFGINIIEDKNKLKAHIIKNNIALQTEKLLVQEHMSGVDLQVFVLAEKGEVKAYSMCLMKGKGSREFIDNEDILNECKKIIKSSSYDGVGLIDIIYDINKKKFYFLEINLRFPASTLYHYAAGINYVHLLLLLSQNKDIQTLFEPTKETWVRRGLLDTILIKLNSLLL